MKSEKRIDFTDGTGVKKPQVTLSEETRLEELYNKENTHDKRLGLGLTLMTWHQLMWQLTVRASITSLKFLLPLSLFFSARMASLGLEGEQQRTGSSMKQTEWEVGATSVPSDVKKKKINESPQLWEHKSEEPPVKLSDFDRDLSSTPSVSPFGSCVTLSLWDWIKVVHEWRAEFGCLYIHRGSAAAKFIPHPMDNSHLLNTAGN